MMRERVAALDGVRGIAIILVIAVHGWYISGGTYGVDLFFVLSGFLITSLLLDERQRTGSIGLRAFYRRRAARLLPALALYITSVVAVAIAAGHSARSEIVDGALAASYSVNLLEVAHSTLVSSNYWHLWSLAEEEQFYLVWPIVLVFLLSRARQHLVMPLLLLSLAISTFDLWVVAPRSGVLYWAYAGPDTHGGPLIVGCIAGALYAKGVRVALMPALVGLAGASAIVAAKSGAFAVPPWTPNLFPVFAAFSALVVVHSMDSRSLLARAFAVRPLVWIGWISYGLYLWHFVFLGLFLSPVVAVAVAVGVAWLSWRYVERPLIRRFRSDRVDELPDKRLRANVGPATSSGGVLTSGASRTAIG